MALLFVQRSFTSFCRRNISGKTWQYCKPFEHQEKYLLFNKVTIRNSSNARYGVASHQRYLKSEPLWRKRDNIPEEYSLIYKTPMAMYFAVGSFVTTGLVMMITVYLLTTDFEVESLFKPLTEDGKLLIAKSKTEVYLFCGLFIFITLTLRFLTKRFVLRMYSHKKDHIAIFQGPLPGLKTRHSFKSGTVSHIPPWSRFIKLHEETSFMLDTKKAYILEDYFRRPRDLRQMLVGYVPDEFDELEDK